MAYRTPKEVQERKDAKRRHILNCAARVFARKGYNGTAVKDIVDEAGISVGSFYFYFKNKEGIFETLFDEINNVLIAISEKIVDQPCDNFVQKATRATTLVLMTVQNYCELAKIMHIEAIGLKRIEQKRAEYEKKLFARLEESFIQMQQCGLIKVADVKVTALAYFGAINSVSLNWLSEEGDGELTARAYPLVVHNLQALQIPFKHDEVKRIINETLLNDRDFVSLV